MTDSKYFIKYSIVVFVMSFIEAEIFKKNFLKSTSHKSEIQIKFSPICNIYVSIAESYFKMDGLTKRKSMIRYDWAFTQALLFLRQ